MTDQPDSGPLPELSSEQEAAVRRLLAEARHDDPIPVEIGDRLDRVLADLAEEAPEAPVDLAAHRRRRNAGRLLLAAAAVIVGGFAVGQMIDVSGSDDSGAGSDSAGSTVAREDSSEDPASGVAPSDGAAADSAAPEAARAEPLELSSQNLERDVQRQLKQSAANTQLNPGAATLSPSYGVEFSCSPATPSSYGLGLLFPAFYDGTATVLAVRPATGPTREAQVLECGTGIPLRTVTVPAG